MITGWQVISEASQLIPSGVMWSFKSIAPDTGKGPKVELDPAFWLYRPWGDYAAESRPVRHLRAAMREGGPR